MELFSNYIETARKLRSKRSQADFLAAIVWYIEDGIEPELKTEAEEVAFQAVLPSLIKQRQRKLAGESSAAKRQRKTNEQANETPTKDERTWQQANKKRSYQDKKLSSIDNPIVPYSDVIDYLNEKTGKNFKASSVSNRKHIRARFNDGYTFQDFVAVIDNMTERWADDPKMEQYLRPETLFGTKFDTYLNSKPKGGNVADFGEYANVI